MIVEIFLTDRKGAERVLKTEAALTLMESIRDNAMGELLALCGHFSTAQPAIFKSKAAKGLRISEWTKMIYW